MPARNSPTANGRPWSAGDASGTSAPPPSTARQPRPRRRVRIGGRAVVAGAAAGAGAAAVGSVLLLGGAGAADAEAAAAPLLARRRCCGCCVVGGAARTAPAARHAGGRGRATPRCPHVTCIRPTPSCGCQLQSVRVRGKRGLFGGSFRDPSFEEERGSFRSPSGFLRRWERGRGGGVGN